MLPIFHQVLGSFLVVTGLIVLPLPLPFGLIMLAIGFCLLAPYIPFIQRMLKTMRGKWPKLDETLRDHHHRMPPVIKRTIDKTHPNAAE